MILGIDISKDKLDVYISEKNKHYELKNTKAAISRFMRAHVNYKHLRNIVFESTGGYEKVLQSYLNAAQLPYLKAHPLRVKRFGESKGYFAKTDKIDAKLLCRYGQQSDVQPQAIQDEKELILKEYSSRKNQLKEMILKEKQRLKLTYLDRTLVKSIKRNIKQLENELALIREKLDKLIESNEALKKKRDILKTFKGIGAEVSGILVTDLPELGCLSREQISLLVGVAPQTKDSGKKKSYRPISQGRFFVRKALYMAALVAVRFNPRMKMVYERLLNRGKKKKVALVAVMRKIIITLNAMIKYESAWQTETNLA